MGRSQIAAQPPKSALDKASRARHNACTSPRASSSPFPQGRRIGSGTSQFAASRVRPSDPRNQRGSCMRISLRLCGSVLLLCSILNAQKTSVVTVAGGYQGNHKPALSASFALPSSVAFDSAGILYVADSDNCEIRKINKNGGVEVLREPASAGSVATGGKRARQCSPASFRP